MANVTKEVYVLRLESARGMPAEIEYLDAMSVDFVRDVASGALSPEEAVVVAGWINDRSNEVASNDERAARDEEEERERLREERNYHYNDRIF